ncbi:Uncharacterised protein [Bordetella pertussis]|nr:Uncharacterised protein [Bordetella pertussis]
MVPTAAARAKKTSVGMPGMRPRPAEIAPAMTRARGCASTCAPMSVPTLEGPSPVCTRVTMIPAQMAMNSAGICAMSPSPMVRMAYVCTASPALRPRCSTPTSMPPSRLTATMIRPAMASPLTNFIAPSMAPYSWLSFSTVRRRRRASSMSMVPARKSASMDICLPGMASSEKRAATSATRSAPLVMTTNCTIVRMRKTTRPTIRLPPTTKLPKVSMMWPASPCSRISRVVAMEMPSRNSVVTSRTEGNEENARGEGRYIATISRTADSVMFAPISTSTSVVGNGRIIMKTIATMSTASTMSLRLVASATARCRRRMDFLLVMAGSRSRKTPPVAPYSHAWPGGRRRVGSAPAWPAPGPDGRRHRVWRAVRACPA